MDRATRGVQKALSLGRYLLWRNRVQRQAGEALLAGQRDGGQPTVRLLDADSARRMPGLFAVFDDADLNGTSSAKWALEGDRLVFSGRVGGENAEYMAQLPFCGFEVRWPMGLDLSPFDLLRVTGRCNLPVKITLRPRVTIVQNESSATLDFPAGGAYESPLRLLKDESDFAFDAEEMLLFNALRVSVSSAVSAPFRLELESLEGVVDSETAAVADLQRVNRFFPVGHWKDVLRRRRNIESSARTHRGPSRPL